MTDNRTLEEILEQESPLHNPAIALLAMREAAKVIHELKAADEVHWKTRRTLLRERDESSACEYSDSGKHECKHCDATHSGLETAPEHRCGVQGFDQMKGDVCPACPQEACECCTPERKCPDHGACVTDGQV